MADVSQIYNMEEREEKKEEWHSADISPEGSNGEAEGCLHLVVLLSKQDTSPQTRNDTV